MFLGKYTHTVDDKGRLTLPASFYGPLAAGLVITRGFERNLMLFPMRVWQTVADRAADGRLTDQTMRAFRRHFFANAVNVTPDRQRRISLTPPLLNYAGLAGEAVIVGLYNYLEVWSKEAWQTTRQEIEDNNLAERWETLGV
ncbi:MAG: division/cell wall cluster transcriptional repressor MraZ [Anaerolineae bacterium]